MFLDKRRETNQRSTTLNDGLLSAIIKTAGKINGENSTNLLLDYLKKEPVYIDAVVNALWTKKASVGFTVFILKI